MKPPKCDQRLLSNRQFRVVYSNGQKYSTPFFSAFIMPTNNGLQRLGLTTTRKIGGAVLRNRCRRRLREIFRLRDQANLKGKSYDLVLNVKPTVATARYEDVKIAFSQLLQRFGRATEKVSQLEVAK